METLYNKIIAEFEKTVNKEKYNEQNIPFIVYIDLYAGQDQFEENFELFIQPALLMDWEIDHTTTPPTALVNFFCCYEQLRDTSNISLNREKGLDFLKYVGITDKILNGLESETTGKLELVSEGFNKMDSIVDIYLLTYQCSYNGRKKNPPGNYQEGKYDTLNLQPNLIQKFEFD